MRLLVPLAVVLLLGACSPAPQDGPSSPAALRTDTLSRHEDGSPKRVAVLRGDSVLERRTYRTTGMLSKVVAGDSVQTYFDLHDPDSAEVFRDYLQGRWRNLSADTSRDRASAFYTFDADRLTFENPSGVALESLPVSYEDHRTLLTEDGMSVQPDIASFDTVRVTGYTLVRQSPPDSL